MSSQFNEFRAHVHVDELRRQADRARAEKARQERAKSPFPKFLRSRRLGRPVTLS